PGARGRLAQGRGPRTRTAPAGTSTRPARSARATASAGDTPATSSASDARASAGTRTSAACTACTPCSDGAARVFDPRAAPVALGDVLHERQPDAAAADG